MAPKARKQTNPGEAKKPTKAEAASAAIDYDEVQNDEVQALEAIFGGDDFEAVEIKGAWSKTTDRSFKLKLRPPGEDEGILTLTVRLTATYPKTSPLLQITGLESYHERTQKRISNILATRPSQLLGEAMIYDITNDINEALEDALNAKQQGTLTSLEDERATAEQASTAMLREAEEADARKAQEEREEEERTLKQMVEDEVSRRESRKPARPRDEPETESGQDIVTFDTSTTVQAGSEKVSFNQVKLLAQVSQSLEQRAYLSKPIFSASESVLVAVKRVTFQKSREDIMEIEEILETSRKLRHPGLVNVLAYRIDRLGATKSELIVCCDLADRGTLYDMLLLGTLHISKARQFAIEMLEALDYLHSNGLAHGSLNARNVALSSIASPRLAEFGYASRVGAADEHSVSWPTPEIDQRSAAMQRKADIWQFGVIVAQMFLGIQVVEQYSSPQLMLGRLDLSDSFDDLLRKMFSDSKRPSAFDLLPAEFLRTNDAAVDQNQSDSTFLTSPAKRRSRHNSSSAFEMSRYATDFTELGRLGKGGFGEVVKARNKLDGGIYAVKKIKQAPHLLDQVISEVMVLNRLNHPYVVRYFSTWIEEDTSGMVTEDSTTETETATDTLTTDEDDGPRMDFGYQSTGGLDFVSSTGYPQVQFGDDSEDDESDAVVNDGDSDAVEDEDEDDEDLAHSTEPEARDLGLRKSRSDSRRAPSVLYIQMEYCERHTLRDLIRKTMNSDDAWRYARQITEGLAHIHGHGIIHRDLKPDNIFMDITGNPKIGDFGLATTAHHQVTDRLATMSGYSGGDMTRSVGTTLYVAPELRSVSNTTYNDKVDMYSLGIIFYEMCEPFSTAMERIRALQDVREKDHHLPAAFHVQGDKAAQGRLIACLIAHKPSERPSSTELLRSEMLPLKIEDETIRQALGGLSDPRSPYHQKMMSALFSHDSANINRVKAMAWDARSPGITDEAKRVRLRSVARQALENVFRRHGAEEARRPSIFPRSDYYVNTNVVQLLDASGNLLQLPYDLTLPHARQLGKQSTPDIRCSYSFGNAYRETPTGGPPRVSEEVDFDIVSHGSDEQRPLDDVEVLKVMDEVVSEMPSFAVSNTVSFHLNDIRILNSILELCRVPVAQQAAVKEIISKLGFHQHTWSKVRVELRKFGLPDTTLDDIQQFDIREVPDKAFSRLSTLFDSASPRVRSRLEQGTRHLMEVVRVATAFGTQRKLYITPLGSVNAKFYGDSFLFQCVLERKSSRIVVAAGGRYDGLIKAHRSPDVRIPVGAVGISIGLDPIISSIAKNTGETVNKKTFLKEQRPNNAVPKRCSILVVAIGTDAVHMAGIKLVAMLWAAEISAELAIARATTADQSQFNFVVTVRHEASTTVKVASTQPGADESDIPTTGLVSHIQQELRELESSKPRQPSLLRQPSHPEVERKSNVQVLLASRGSKKSNKYQIINDAQEQWSSKMDAAKDAPILAVETRDDVLDLVQQTRLSDAESWRKAVQSVQLNDRQYVQQMREMLVSWRTKWTEGDGMREACIFNFRTQYCIYYDLGL